jgi:hypothetical protein
VTAVDLPETGTALGRAVLADWPLTVSVLDRDEVGSSDREAVGLLRSSVVVQGRSDAEKRKHHHSKQHSACFHCLPIVRLGQIQETADDRGFRAARLQPRTQHLEVLAPNEASLGL